MSKRIDLDIVAGYFGNINKMVWKNHRTTTKHQPKPFKSGRKVNTVTGIVTHPVTNQPCYTFVEDGSYVECFRCSIAPDGLT